MMRVSVAIAVLVAAGPVWAKPLITSSEETHARICLAQDESSDRLLAACDNALAAAGLTETQRIELIIARGDALSWLDRDAEAEKAFRAALESDPLAVDAWNGLGWVLRATDRDQEAFEAFSKSLEIDVSVQGLGGQAATGRTVGAIDGETARQMLEASLAIDPDFMWSVREIAWSWYEEDEDAEAADAFRRALDADPDDTNALYGFGRASLNLGEHNVALEQFNALLAIDPDDTRALTYRIRTLRYMDRNAQALRDADRMIADYPDMTTGYIERGRALMSLQRRSEALETYRDADERFGPSNHLLYWYADALSDDGQMAEALGVIDRALELEGADYSDHLLKSYIALELKDYPLARDAAEASLETGVEDAWAHYYIAITMVHDNQSDEAMGRFDRAIELGLPDHRVGAFASELIDAGKFIEAAKLRLKY